MFTPNSAAVNQYITFPLTRWLAMPHSKAMR
jgi:hypothetical protein